MDNRNYYAEGKSVYLRHGRFGNSGGSSTVVASGISGRIAKLIANCLNLYNRNSRFAASVNAAEKGEHEHGNRNDRTTEGNSTTQHFNPS